MFSKAKTYYLRNHFLRAEMARVRMWSSIFLSFLSVFFSKSVQLTSRTERRPGGESRPHAAELLRGNAQHNHCSCDIDGPNVTIKQSLWDNDIRGESISAGPPLSHGHLLKSDTDSSNKSTQTPTRGTKNQSATSGADMGVKSRVDARPQNKHRLPKRMEAKTRL